MFDLISKCFLLISLLSDYGLIKNNQICAIEGIMKVAIIGAGPSGLISAKYCIDAGFVCDVFEQSGNVGGLWVYTDKTDFDENGLPIHSAAYEGLRTNLPKELMQFSMFPYSSNVKRSFITQPEVLQYFQTFANHFNLTNYVKFYRHVTKVSYLENKKWLIVALDLKNKMEEEGFYDAVIICSGHHHKPLMIDIQGGSTFKGIQMHSHSYRKAEKFNGKRVLLIGAGPSGTDISNILVKSALKVFLSHRNVLKKLISDQVILKPEVEQLSNDTALFKDGTVEKIDAIIYCTGYQYSFPFLDKSTKIDIVQKRFVKPLFKQIINIEHPTMAFIGILNEVFLIIASEIQVKFFMASLTGHFKLPSKEEMLEDLQKLVRYKQEVKQYPKHVHLIRDGRKYYEELTSTANLSPIDNVLMKLYDAARFNRNVSYCYRIVDSESFVQSECML